MQASPYRQLADDFLASSASFCLVVAFVCSYAFKDAALTTLPDIQSKLSAEQRTVYIIDPVTLTAILFASLIATFCISFVLFTIIFAAERRRALREALASKARRLRSTEDDAEVPASPLPAAVSAGSPRRRTCEYHLFLSQ